LSCAANVAQHDVPGVTVKLLVAKRHTPVEPKPPVPRAVSSSDSTSIIVP
jgi:hypothetical protein